MFRYLSHLLTASSNHQMDVILISINCMCCIQYTQTHIVLFYTGFRNIAHESVIYISSDMPSLFYIELLHMPNKAFLQASSICFGSKIDAQFHEILPATYLPLFLPTPKHLYTFITLCSFHCHIDKSKRLHEVQTRVEIEIGLCCTHIVT